jgi:predicted membrane protein
MGAGQGNLHFRDIPLTRLDLNLGAGQMDIDFTGDRKADLTAVIEGGVGQANIRLPKNVGVIATASGGIGSIRVHGLTKDGDSYTNEAYKKTPVTIHLKVEGGIGNIALTEEP